QAMPPIDEKIADEDDFENLQPEGLVGDTGAECLNGSVKGAFIQPIAESVEHHKNQAAEKEILPEKKEEVREEIRAKKALAGLRWKDFFQRAKDQQQKEETEPCGNE
ncbi:MAG: hypothetical protein AAF570_15470, partial [Bacteroidota bacterium]